MAGFRRSPRCRPAIGQLLLVCCPRATRPPPPSADGAARGPLSRPGLSWVRVRLSSSEFPRKSRPGPEWKPLRRNRIVSAWLPSRRNRGTLPDRYRQRSRPVGRRLGSRTSPPGLPVADLPSSRDPLSSPPDTRAAPPGPASQRSSPSSKVPWSGDVQRDRRSGTKRSRPASPAPGAATPRTHTMQPQRPVPPRRNDKPPHRVC